MIPYFHIAPFDLGFVSVHPFGILAALAVVSGLAYGYFLAQREFAAGAVFLDMAPWFLVPGFVLSHLVSLAFYYPSQTHSLELWRIVNIAQGLSSFGGLFGGAAGACLYMRRHRLPVLPWLDILARAFALGYVFGRLGCSIAHDHPGLPTDFPLAMDYPARDGFPAGPRHDLGFYELWFWVVTITVFHRLGARRRPDGFFTAGLILSYCPIRFGLDFLRTNDAVYLGLTFAQWSCMAVLPAGLWLLWQMSRHPRCSTRIGVPYEPGVSGPP